MALSGAANCAANIKFFKNSSMGNEPKFDSAHLATTVLKVIELQSLDAKTILKNEAPLPSRASTLLEISLTDIREISSNSSYMGALKFTLFKDGKEGKNITGPNKVIRTLPIHLGTTNNGTIQTIVGCSSFSSSLSLQDQNNLKLEFCNSVSGIYDPVTGKCDIGPYYQP